MTTYERLDESGAVVERVTTVDGSHEDTRIGVAAIDGTGGWRVVGTVEPPPPPPAASKKPDEQLVTDPGPKGGGRDRRVRASDR